MRARTRQIHFGALCTRLCFRAYAPLTELNLGNNKLISLSPWAERLPRLRTLDCRWNNLTAAPTALLLSSAMTSLHLNRYV